MPQEEPVVPGEGASSGRELAAKWAQDEARAGVKRVGKGMLLLALVLLLGAFLTPNPEVTYSTGPGRTIGWSGWYGLIPPLPPSTGFVSTVMNWVTWLIAFLVTDIGALCRFLTVVPVAWKASVIPDALLYGALGVVLIASKSKAAAVLLLLLTGAGLVITVLRLNGTLTGDSGNVIVSLLAFIGAMKGCQLTWS
jgi:hypothetical protein